MLHAHSAQTVQNTPVADAKPEDIQDLLGGALFKALYKWMLESGPVYLLPTGKFLFAASCMLLTKCSSEGLESGPLYLLPTGRRLKQLSSEASRVQMLGSSRACCSFCATATDEIGSLPCAVCRPCVLLPGYL